METQNELNENLLIQEMVNVCDLQTFKKLNFDRFEILIGRDEYTQYIFDNIEDENYGMEVEEQDYNRFNLIDKERFDLIDFKGHNEISLLISDVKSSRELYNELNDIVRSYLERNTHYSEEIYFSLKNFQFVYIVDGVETEIED